MIIRQLHGTTEETEPVAMLLPYTLALTMSAGMSLATCFTVFKWTNVMRDAGHGTMFMVFASEGLWSLLSLARMVGVYINNRLSTLEYGPILHMTISSEIFFNTTSLWFMAVAYEIQRRALNARSVQSSRVAMTWYTTVIFGLTLVMHITMTLLELLDVKIPITTNNGDVEMQHLVDHVLNYMTWFTWGTRSVSVVFAGLVALWLYWQRARVSFHRLPTALMWIVSLFFVLNMPYLVQHTLRDVGVIEPNESPMLTSALKCATFLHGAIISVIMGQAVGGFDVFFHVSRQFGGAKHLEFFVFSESQSVIRY
ncbi:hypothetical protein H257_03705 [Aphanomyces astaci]|uniref:Intimal thickness related receptor IRP domain-containing protein n=1 Tax=Aphanomyces astaci TaxID=112090 RepID=W4GXS3_APHAT|nr:hypothetical protein H257_03705 [Aphanomyces astaci]ETV84525.1 hypothetical protein H257_03705 [Aphanomyces astaci]KAF0712915.1 hypothetical protein AaE_011921 [Aphanomyces astaci]RHY10084.1 hypothetical protein DYB36_006670 [Aphanomyces astaci]RHY96707.1 hypothetical protein DYB35_005776 [Aphanomyces astaci]RHZ16997.1 hypothetical protein DYB37_008807 [Aphanomyces astaci]|eukprot:XP_009826217.1 hypothetical protein H257_03705 [Aphanomyces astaci]